MRSSAEQGKALDAVVVAAEVRWHDCGRVGLRGSAGGGGAPPPLETLLDETGDDSYEVEYSVRTLLFLDKEPDF